MKVTGSIKSDSFLKANQGHDTTVQEEIVLKSIETLVKKPTTTKQPKRKCGKKAKKKMFLY